MFKLFKSLDKTFQQVRLLAMLSILCSMIVCTFLIWRTYAYVARIEGRIYVLINGNAFPATEADEKDYLSIEAGNHVRDFHELLFNLDPDDKKIKANYGKAAYLADGSAKTYFDGLREKGFIMDLISANMTKRVQIDSVVLSPGEYPYAFGFECWGKEILTRATTETRRPLYTRGQLRRIGRSEDNSHGFLIEGFQVVENTKSETKNR